MTRLSVVYMDIRSMKTLIVTQKLDPDDYVFGFFYGHIIDIAHECEEVHVMCLEYSKECIKLLPKNVIVHSLGKNEGLGRLGYLNRFYGTLFRKYTSYDIVLVHMEPLYVLLGGFFWRMMGKRVVLWYNHVYVDSKLRLAGFLVHEIIGVSKQGVPISHPHVRLITYEHDLTYLLTHT